MSLRQSLENLVSAVKLPRRILVISALACISMPGVVAAQYQKLDGIVAVVDDDVVLASELRTELIWCDVPVKKAVPACRLMTF